MWKKRGVVHSDQKRNQVWHMEEEEEREGGDLKELFFISVYIELMVKHEWEMCQDFGLSRKDKELKGKKKKKSVLWATPLPSRPTFVTPK